MLEPKSQCLKNGKNQAQTHTPEEPPILKKKSKPRYDVLSKMKIFTILGMT